jgi:NAD(P)-dependent dehydrogenase (short-subunit alcohol dehydrogenase family)
MKAIVTGHSKGLGAAIAAELLGRGIPVLGLARSHAPELAARFPNLLSEVALDLGDGAALAGWLAGPALGEYLAGSGTALLVNNAGVVSPIGPLHAQDPAAVLGAVTLNVGAPLALAAALVRAGGATERRIVHISSGAARNAYPGWSVYCATKAALDQHARAVALDADPMVRACSLAPGVIDTGMQAEIRAAPSQRFPMRERFVQLKAGGALTAPEDCARALVDYLLAPGFGRTPVDDLRQR